jgi:hypothetical protein
MEKDSWISTVDCPSTQQGDKINFIFVHEHALVFEILYDGHQILFVHSQVIFCPYRQMYEADEHGLLAA